MGLPTELTIHVAANMRLLFHVSCSWLALDSRGMGAAVCIGLLRPALPSYSLCPSTT